jgi:hypothetical protein
MGSRDSPSSHRVVENLIAAYAEPSTVAILCVGVLLADAIFIGAAGSVSGGDAIQNMLRDEVIVYCDDTPRTKHIATKLVIEVDDAASQRSGRLRFARSGPPSPSREAVA